MTEEKIGKLIITTALKTIMVVMGFLCLVVTYVFVISPNSLSKVYGKLGMGRAEIATYEQIYAKSGKNADLYNLIQKCLEKENFEKSKEYITELLAKDNFNSFASAVNCASIEKASNNAVAFVVDLESYLNSQLLVCEYRLGFTEKAKDMALADLEKTDNKYSFLLGIYYDEVLTDLSLTVGEARSCLIDVYNTDGVKALIEDKIDAIIYETETNVKLKIASLYTKIKVLNYKRNLMSFVREDISAITAEIEDLKEIYETLV